MNGDRDQAFPIGPPPGVAMVVLIVFAVVFGASLFGILTRPLGFLAAFWPANALLLGLFVRFPRFASLPGWIAAIAAYYAADLATGGNVLLTTWLTAANLAGVATAVILFQRVDITDRRLQQPRSVLYLFAILCAGACAAAVVGAGAAPVFFGSDIVSGLAFWFTTELVNGIVILPVMLTAPWPLLRTLHQRRGGDLHEMLRRVAPLLAVVASVLLGLAIGGPGAIAFPSPALLWCALTLSLFTTAVMTMLVSSWHLLAFSLGLLTSYSPEIDVQIMSDRIGITLLALGPLTVASIHAAKLAILRRLEVLASTDTLTGAASRAAFLERGHRVAGNPGAAVLMLDIDGFKRINDAHGHATGDRALQAFAAAVRAGIRDDDLFGRLGGEEFALILPASDTAAALAIAERLRQAVAELRIDRDGEPLGFTVSIGVANADATGRASLDDLLASADRALYRAKSAGRNRVVRDEPAPLLADG